MAIFMVAKQTFSSECKYGNWGTLLKSSSGYIWINKLIQKHIGFVSNVCLFYSIHHHFEQKYAEMYFVTTVKVIVVPTLTHTPRHSTYPDDPYHITHQMPHRIVFPSNVWCWKSKQENFVWNVRAWISSIAPTTIAVQGRSGMLITFEFMRCFYFDRCYQLPR